MTQKTLQRLLQNDSIICNMNEVGQTKRYTTHELIQNFLQIAALPPTRVLQLSCSVGSLLQLDFLAASNTPVDVGGSPTNWQQAASCAQCAAAATH